jgi:uncharacterized membrane protein YeaQ/YmgE (transglycosylase-associated protein family)
MPIVVIVVVVLAVIVLGWIIVGLTLKLLGLVLLGLVTGALARLVLPGRQELGVLATILYGIGGSLMGGIVGDAIGFGSVLQFVLAVATAAVLIAIFAATAPRTARI